MHRGQTRDENSLRSQCFHFHFYYYYGTAGCDCLLIRLIGLETVFERRAYRHGRDGPAGRHLARCRSLQPIVKRNGEDINKYKEEEA